MYDVTSTYFEGEAKANPQAQRGHSRDSRPDCKQVCIGLVVRRAVMEPGSPIAREFALSTRGSRRRFRSFPSGRGTAVSRTNDRARTTVLLMGRCKDLQSPSPFQSICD